MAEDVGGGGSNKKKKIVLPPLSKAGPPQPVPYGGNQAGQPNWPGPAGQSSKPNLWGNRDAGGTDPGPFEHGAPGRERVSSPAQGGVSGPPGAKVYGQFPGWQPGASGGDDGGDGGYYYDNGGNNGGGGPSEEPIVWERRYEVANAPAWWGGYLPSRLDPLSEYGTMLNGMIPYLSGEDQRVVAGQLARMFPDSPFAAYSPVSNESFPPPPLTTPTRQQFSSRERAMQVLGVLDTIRTTLGKSQTDFGPGYGYLQEVASVLRDYGGQQAAPQSRQQYLQQLGALDPLLAETKGDALGAYGPLARMLTNPFFSAGAVRPVSRDQSGEYRFGVFNRRLAGA